MKFLVTGSAGLIGSQVVQDLTKQNHTVYSCYHDVIPECGIITKLDLTNPDDIKKTVNEISPDVIIHLAAMTGVDLCETEQDLAMTINAKATKILAEQAAKNNCFFVYVSTDYVFDGKIGMKKENDSPNPLGFYGKSKLAGELSLNNLASGWCIARTSTPFGNHSTKKSFPLWVKENLESKKEIPVLTDQFTSPTYVPNLSKMLIEVTSKQISGIIHLAGATRISRYDLAQLVAEKLHLEKKLLSPTKIDNMNWKAQRPMDSSLDVSYAAEILDEKPQEIQQSLELFLSNLDT
ncbi:MAG: dTDP-4-dehydrorhamnose reductase [Candidatus Nitrosopelagicus sp.]|nr:dTDP-4-dehydrorhamnose reductase [Candidatus Nitrosopelagicus sp.]